MPAPSRETADRWNRELQAFRFRFAHGGHASDLDIIHGRIRFQRGEPGLLALCRRLDLELKPIPPDAPRVEPGRSYTLDVSRGLWDPITEYPRYARPGFTTLFSVPVSLEVHAEDISVIVTGARGFSWDVLEEDFENARMLEQILELRGIVVESG